MGESMSSIKLNLKNSFKNVKQCYLSIFFFNIGLLPSSLPNVIYDVFLNNILNIRLFLLIK